VDPPRLFKFLNADCRPIAIRSRKHNAEDEKFIEKEIQELLKSGIIEEANTPWRAQVLVARNDRHKPRIVIDYSQTINRFTQLDAYPLPRIKYQVAELSKCKFFSTLDLKSAYHQVPLALEQWFSNCGMRTTSGTRGFFRWYSSSFPVIFEKFVNSFLCYNSFVRYANVANSFICYINVKYI